MGVAPGGLIKQCILEDENPASIWEPDHTICFNVQILNSNVFCQVTGMDPPKTPISAATYAVEGLPFFQIYNETSNVEGDFGELKSVKQIDNNKNESSHAALSADDNEGMNFTSSHMHRNTQGAGVPPTTLQEPNHPSQPGWNQDGFSAGI